MSKYIPVPGTMGMIQACPYLDCVEYVTATGLEGSVPLPPRSVSDAELAELILQDATQSKAFARMYYLELAKRMVAKHVPGWSVQLTNSVKVLGRCCYSKQTIELSVNVIQNIPEQITDTVLHEIAHALTPGDGHGTKWQAACKRVGALPEEYYRGGAIAPPKYALCCESCGPKGYRYVRVKVEGRVCSRCLTPIYLKELTAEESKQAFEELKG